MANQQQTQQAAGLETTALFDRVFGALVGGSIGDALGGPVEGMTFRKIRETHGPDGVVDFLEYRSPPGYLDITKIPYSATAPTPGTYTDDSRLKFLLCSAIVSRGRRVTAVDVARTWEAEMNPDLFWYSIASALYKLSVSNIDVRDCGIGNVPDNSSAMQIAPVGILNPGDPQRAFLEAADVASISHTGTSKELAGVLAAAVAEAMSPSATVDSVIEASVAYADYKNGIAEAVERAVEFAKDSSDQWEYIEKMYEQGGLMPWAVPNRLLGIPESDTGASLGVHPMETVVGGLGAFYLADGDYRKTVLAGANFGRDCDSQAGMIGAVAGAFNGAGGIPEDWISTSLEVNPDPDQREVALRLTEIIVNEAEQAGERVEAIRELRGAEA